MVLVAYVSAPEPRPAPTGPSVAQLARVDAAVASLNASRAPVLATPDVLPAAATAADAADEASATGDAARAADARSAARRAAAAVDEAVVALPGQAAAYREALADLGAAGEALAPAQREALVTVAAAGEREAAAQEAFVRVGQQVWPAFEALGEVQDTWLERASAGWYRSRGEAAAGYVVLRRPVQPPVEQARTALAQADTARRPPTAAMREALAAADAALAPLRGGSGSLPG